MRPSLLHRLLGLAQICALSDDQAVVLRSHAAAIQAERARNDRQDRQMTQLATNAANLANDLSALTGDFEALTAAVADLKANPPVGGEAVTPETAAAIQSVTDGFDALVARLAAASAPSPSTGGDGA